MKIRIEDMNGTVIRDNETYVVEDVQLLENLTVSKTVLHVGKETTGHSHKGLEEVYMFESGTGTMQLSNDVISVTAGDIILIKEGEFHKVYNEGNQDLVFVCVFQKYDRNE